MFSCNSLRRPLVLSWATSFVLHGGFIALVLAEAAALISFSFQPAAPKPFQRVITIASGWSKLQPATESIPVKLTQERELPGASDTDTKPVIKPVDSQPVESTQIDSMVQQAVEQAQARSNEENLDELRRLAGTLNQVSDADSINGLSNSLNKVFQTAPRATEPSAEPVAGEFDFNTAQIHDVRREEVDGGGYAYTAILLDAAGRTLDSELDEETGARIYEVMSLIKQNPLLASIYRKTLMGLFDKMLNPNAASTSTATGTTSQPILQNGTNVAPPAEVRPNSPQPGVPFDPFAE